MRFDRWAAFRWRALIVASLAVATCVCQIGCKKSTTAATVQIVDVNVVVVLSPGEQIGGSANRGCRLTLVQITDHLKSLNSFAKAHWGFQIRYSVDNNDLVDPATFEDAELTAADLPLSGTSARRFGLTVWLIISLATAAEIPELHVDGKVNIYFTGNIITDPLKPRGTGGNTVDPKDATQPIPECPTCPPVKRHILVNDLAFDDPGPGTTHLDWNTLPHEFSHYLLRERNPMNGGRYDAREHAPKDSGQLMQRNSPHPPVTVRADAEEIKQVVQLGLVNSP